MKTIPIEVNDVLSIYAACDARTGESLPVMKAVVLGFESNGDVAVSVEGRFNHLIIEAAGRGTYWDRLQDVLKAQANAYGRMCDSFN